VPLKSAVYAVVFKILWSGVLMAILFFLFTWVTAYLGYRGGFKLAGTDHREPDRYLPAHFGNRQVPFVIP
jgi:hypothetical protein